MGFQISGDSELEFVSNVDANLLMEVSAGRNIDEITLSYIVIGIPPSFLCSNCKEQYAYQNECRDSCPAGSYEFTYRDSGKACRECSGALNFIPNVEEKTC